jgi:hypothetical protein
MSMKTVKAEIGDILSPVPNWSGPVTERLEFRTSIIESRNGREQREAIRQRPRVSYDFRADQLDRRVNHLWAELHDFPTGIGEGLSVFPLVWRYVTLTTTHTIGLQVLTVDESDRWWLQDGARIVIDNGEAMEAHTVASVGSGTISIEDPTTIALAAGNRVYAAFDARLKDEQTLDYSTSRHAAIALQVEGDPGTLDDWPDTISVPVHEGYPAFIETPNWRKKVSARITDNRDVIDFGYGRVQARRNKDFATVQQTMGFTFLDPAKADRVMAFFNHAKGRRGYFWMPTQTHDFALAATAAVDTDQLVVVGEHYSIFEDSDAFNTVMVKWPDGAIQFNRITALSTGSGATTLTFYDTWEREVTSACMICWAFWARFFNDTMETSWLSSGKGESTLSFKSVPNIELATEGGPVYCKPMVWKNKVNPSFDDASDDWVQIPFAYGGLSLHAVDRAIGRLSWSVSGGFKYRPPFDTDPGYGGNTNGWNDGDQVRVSVKFYRENGTEVAHVSGDSPNFNINPAGQGPWSFSGSGEIPFGARYARVVYTSVNALGFFFGGWVDCIGTVCVTTTYPWGLDYQETNLYVP